KSGRSSRALSRAGPRGVPDSTSSTARRGKPHGGRRSAESGDGPGPAAGGGAGRASAGRGVHARSRRASRAVGSTGAGGAHGAPGGAWRAPDTGDGAEERRFTFRELTGGGRSGTARREARGRKLGRRRPVLPGMAPPLVVGKGCLKHGHRRCPRMRGGKAYSRS